MPVETFEQGLEFIKQRYEEASVKKALKDFDKTLEITCVDSGRQFLIIVHKDQGIEIQDQTGDDSAPVKIQFKEEQRLPNYSTKKLARLKPMIQVKSK